jgi:hypothetical protein
MARVTLWTSSAAVRPERYDGGLEQGTHSGGTSSFRIPAGQEVWFHFPIPTAWQILDTSLYLERVAVLWETDDNTEISEVVAYHGATERYPLSSKSQRGSHLVAGEENTYQVRDMGGSRPKTGYGVQASLKVRSTGQAGTITFGGAGATYHDTSS